MGIKSSLANAPGQGAGHPFKRAVQSPFHRGRSHSPVPACRHRDHGISGRRSLRSPRFSAVPALRVSAGSGILPAGPALPCRILRSSSSPPAPRQSVRHPRKPSPAFASCRGLVFRQLAACPERSPSDPSAGSDFLSVFFRSKAVPVFTAGRPLRHGADSAAADTAESRFPSPGMREPSFRMPSSL